MKIKRLHLKNWCQHEDLEVEFSTGLVGIVGKNGAGKSNVIRGLVFALTGYVTGKKDDYVRYGTSAGSTSVDFVEDSTQTVYRIVRNVHNSGIELYRQTGSEFELVSDKATHVREILSDLVPLSPDVAQQIFAVPQEDMVSLLRETPSKRAEILQRVFDLQFFARVRQKLLNVLKTADLKAQDLQSRILLLKDQESAKVQYLSTFAELPDRESLDSGIALLSKEYEGLAGRLGAQKMREYLLPLLQQLTEERSEVLSRIEAPEPVYPADLSKEELEHELAVFEESASELRNLLKLLDSAIKTPKPEPFDHAQLEALEQLQAEESARHTEARKHWDMVRGCGTSGICPTCRQPTEWTERHLSEAQAAVVNLRQSLEARKPVLEKMREEERLHRRAEAAYERLWEEIREHRDGCTPETAAVVLEDAKLRLSEALCSVERLKETLGRVQGWETAQSQWLLEQQNLEERLASLDTSLAEITANPAMQTPELTDREEVEARLEVLTEQIQELKDKQLQRIQLDAYAAELDAIRQDRLSYERSYEESNPQLREDIRVLADILHAKNLPARVAFDIYRALSDTLNVYLQDLDAPYRVELQDNGDFVCVFDTGMRQLASRLSGGEKMMLSVAFRLALHFVFATNDAGGFIFLDEPTTFLDERNRDALVKVLNTLKTSPKFRDIQIFVVTHDELLSPIFNKVIQV